MPIKHRVFSEKVQNLGWFPEGKTKNTKSIGFVEPHTSYDFGIIERHEEITITSGAVRINGQDWYPESGIFHVTPGMQVVFEALGEIEASSYLCTFPGETR